MHSDVLQEKKGEPYNYRVSFELAVTNIIANIVYGQRLEMHSDVLQEKKGEPYNYRVSFELAVTNIRANIVYGQR